MNLQYNPYAALALAGTTIAVLLSVRIWRRHPAPGARAIAILMAAVAVWCLGYALELASSDLHGKIFWSKVSYLGIVVVPVAWFLFALAYTGNDRGLSPRGLAGLAVIPCITLGLVWTNESHGLFWSQFELDTGMLYAMSRLEHGIGFWLHCGYSYLLLTAAAFLILRACVRSFALYRKQGIALMIATFVPWAGNVLYVAGWGPFVIVDPTPFAFIITGISLAWGLYRYRLWDLVPIARETILENLQEAVIVLDGLNRIVDAKPGRIGADRLPAQPGDRHKCGKRDDRLCQVGQPLSGYLGHSHRDSDRRRSPPLF